MRYRLVALFFLLSGLSANAQDTHLGFEQRALEAAATPGGTRIPILCGGFFRSLALDAEPETSVRATNQSREEALSNIGIAVHLLDSGEDKEAATQFIGEKVSAVSDVYRDWFAFIKSNGPGLMPNELMNSFTYCNEQYDEWSNKAPGSN